MRASATDPAALVVAYLGEILVLEETSGFLGRSIVARTRGRPSSSVIATIRGEPYDPDRHIARTQVKAITYHGLVFDPRAGRARVIVDI